MHRITLREALILENMLIKSSRCLKSVISWLSSICIHHKQTIICWPKHGIVLFLKQTNKRSLIREKPVGNLGPFPTVFFHLNRASLYILNVLKLYRQNLIDTENCLQKYYPSLLFSAFREHFNQMRSFSNEKWPLDLRRLMDLNSLAKASPSAKV